MKHEFQNIQRNLSFISLQLSRLKFIDLIFVMLMASPWVQQREHLKARLARLGNIKGSWEAEVQSFQKVF